MCVVCVQVIANCQQKMLDPHLLGRRREQVESEVQDWQGDLLQHKAQLAEVEAAISKTSEALFEQGEPSNVAMPILLPCMPPCQ